MNISQSALKKALKTNGYPLFTGDLNVTLVGVRSADTSANSFNDVLCVLVELDGKKRLFKYPMTADPGTFYRENPLNVDGTAVLVPGHYKSCWRLGAHRGKYRALVQHGLMSVYRDSNKNRSIELDKSTIQSGFFGINLHRASVNNYSLQVDKWSAGCQVLANPDDFEELMDLLEQSAAKYGNSFSYTLLDEACLTPEGKQP